MIGRTVPVALLAALLAAPAGAQGLDAEGAIDTIVGSRINEQEASAQDDTARVVRAIDKAADNAAAVRKVSEVSEVAIVFLSDAATTEGGPPAEIEAKLRERKDDVDALRQEIEGNALLYHAINSKQVLMREVLAVEIGDDRRVIVYAAAKPAN
jgi:hypothetical protein